MAKYCLMGIGINIVNRICKQNRLNGTFGNSVKAYEAEPEALKEFFRQAGQAVDTTHLTDSVTMLTKEGFELKHEVFCMMHRLPNPKR